MLALSIIVAGASAEGSFFTVPPTSGTPSSVRLALPTQREPGMGTLKELQYLSLVSKVTAGEHVFLSAHHACWRTMLEEQM